MQTVPLARRQADRHCIQAGMRAGKWTLYSGRYAGRKAGRQAERKN
jgi:hypothetical protein